MDMIEAMYYFTG